jgi:hypothetical protein
MGYNSGLQGLILRIKEQETHLILPEHDDDDDDNDDIHTYISICTSSDFVKPTRVTSIPLLSKCW